MCYNDVSSTTCERVISILDSHPEDFLISVRILALVHTNLDKATELIINQHPTVAAEYGASVFRDSKEKVSLGPS